MGRCLWRLDEKRFFACPADYKAKDVLMLMKRIIIPHKTQNVAEKMVSREGRTKKC